MPEDNKDTIADPKTIGEIESKMRLEGVVKSTEIFGVLVDVGVDHDGLLHISEIKKYNDGVNKQDLGVGQKITVWVKKTDEGAGQISLTLKEPLALEWNDLKSGETYIGNVTRLERFGAFVDIGAERPGLVHVREITTGRLEHPEEILSIGEEVEVQLVGINRKKRQINLSMRTLEQQFMDSEGDDDPVPTAMELALRAAMEPEAEEKQDKPQRNKKESNGTQEDILRRTLEGRPND